jgi:hypothetical protein
MLIKVSSSIVDKGGIRLYSSKRARSIAVARLIKSGCTYFTGFKDSNQEAPFGLSFGSPEWPKRECAKYLSGIWRKDC